MDNLTFTLTGNGINQTVKTNSKGEIQIDNLMPGVYTVTEMDYDKYEPQESRRVTVVSGQVSTVTFNNKLMRGDLQIVKSSENNLNEGVTFHLYGTSLSGIAVDEYAVTDVNGVATFEDVLISGSTPYTVEEVDTAIRYVVPEAQSAPINWNEVTNRSFLNILKKFSVTVTKSDAETGTAQVMLLLLVLFTASIRAKPLLIPTPPTKTGSSLLRSISAITTGRCERSHPPRAICLIPPSIRSAQSRSSIPWSIIRRQMM